MTKDGQTFSKFSKEALEIGAAVSAAILKKVRNVFEISTKVMMRSSGRKMERQRS
jgi:hypothetical protein